MNSLQSRSDHPGGSYEADTEGRCGFAQKPNLTTAILKTALVGPQDTRTDDRQIELMGVVVGGRSPAIKCVSQKMRGDTRFLGCRGFPVERSADQNRVC